MNKIDGLISIARKAGYVVMGQDNLLDYDKKLYLLLLDKKAGNSLTREINFLSKKKDIPMILIDELGKITAVENCKVLGIKNKSFSDSIVKCLKGE